MPLYFKGENQPENSANSHLILRAQPNSGLYVP
jgi:hypothetical protein